MSLPLRAVVVWVSVACVVTSIASAAVLRDGARREAIDRYLSSRNGSGIVCLYTFDRFRASVNVPGARASSASDQDAADDQLLVTIPPTFEELIGADCPFGDLQFDPELVRSVRNANSTSAQGVHLSEDPHKDVKRPQIASNDVVPAKEFYMSATGLTGGFSFEFSYRRRVETNQTMTLFSIGNRFGSCVDPGFRVDLISTHVIMVNYFIPVLQGNDIACYERRLFSASMKRCVMPRYRPSSVDDNPVVQVIITFDSSGAGFFLKYVDPVTTEVYECNGRDSMKDPDGGIEYDYIRGTYRLFIGNNPRNVSSPLKRSRIAPVRQYRNPDWDDRPAEERLRDMIKHKLNALVGPRLPASFRLFGGKSLSMSFFTVSLPPVNEDTPFKWARNAIADFKKEHGDDIVEFIVKSLRDGKKENTFGINVTTDAPDDGQNLNDPFSTSTAPPGTNTTRRARKGIYPNANGSTFDIFHFAIYRKPLTADEVREKYWNTWMTPLRPFMELKRIVRIHEDREVLFELTQLDSILDDIQLEITQLPELGKVLLYPNRTLLTPANLAAFREMPMDAQRKIYFASNPHENNNNIRGAGIGRRLDPYSVIRYRAWKTTTGRQLNATHEATIEIWVDPFQETSAHQVTDIDVHNMRPVYLDLRGAVRDGASGDEGDVVTPRARSRQLGLFDGLSLLGKNISDTMSKAQSKNFSQAVRILELPRYGRLYDRRMDNVTDHLRGARSADLNTLEPYRIRREWIVNRTFSTSLVFIYDAQNAEPSDDRTVDLLQYQVRGAASAEYSAPALVKFHLLTTLPGSDDETPENNASAIRVVEVNEDGAVTISLSEIEAFQLDSSIQFIINQLPRHGKLYQYQEESTLTAMPNGSVGLRIHSQDTPVQDTRGRVVYAPDIGYFNLPDDVDGIRDGMDDALDAFAYAVVTAQEHDTVGDSSSRVDRGRRTRISGTRRVHLQVANSPGMLSILPPTVFSTNATRGEAVHVPVVFDDPDEYSGPYRVTLIAEDDTSEFELGHAITNDDVLKYCPFKRPCSLIRSANANFVSNANGDKDEREDWKLLYHVKTRSLDPSNIDVEGSKTALEYALQNLIFRDQRNSWSWHSDNTARFGITIERSNAKNHAKTQMRYYVDFVSSSSGDDDTDSLGQGLSNLVDFVSMGLWIAVLCFVLSSASCCSMGFCCCCTRARAEKRHQFEDERRRYVEQVVQNDREYSAVLLALAASLCDPEFRVVGALLRCCGQQLQNERTVMQLLCLISVAPLLEAERLFPALVLRLACDESAQRVDDTTFAYPRVAGLALAHFCNEKGEAWVRKCVRSVLRTAITGPETTPGDQLVLALEENMATLPTGIAHVCKRYADSTSGLDGLTDPTEAVHVVFFNHFLAPALWFTKTDLHGVRLSRSQRWKLRQAARTFVSFRDVVFGADTLSDDDGGLMDRYKVLLQGILTSSCKDEAASIKPEADCGLIGACLMNLHSILDGVLPALEAEENGHDASALVGFEKSLEDDDDVSGELDVSSLAKIKRLLRALNFPITSCEALESSAESALLSKPLFWTGFSCDEWRTRVRDNATNAKHRPKITARRATQKAATYRRGESLLAVDVAGDEEAASTVFEASRSCEREGTGPVEFTF